MSILQNLICRKNYEPKLNELFYYIRLPILAELNHLEMIDFVATFQDEKVKFLGTIKNTSNRPILVPRVKILAVREDRKIILEKILTLKDKIIMPNFHNSIIDLKQMHVPLCISGKGRGVEFKWRLHRGHYFCFYIICI